MIDFKNLKHGSLVRHKSGGKAFTVMANYGDRVTAVRTVDLTNPSEWDEVDEAGEIVPEYYRPVIHDILDPSIDPMPRILVGDQAFPEQQSVRGTAG